MVIPHSQVVLTCLLIVAGLALGVILYLLQTIIIPFLFAVILMYVLEPLVDWLSKKRSIASFCPGSKDWGQSFSAESFAPDYEGGADQGEELSEYDEQACLVPGTKSFAADKRSYCTRLYYCRFTLCPRWFAALLAIGFSFSILGLCFYYSYLSIKSLESKKELYKEGLDHVMKLIAEVLAMLRINVQDGVVPWMISSAKGLTPSILDALSFYVEKCALIIIFLVYLLLSPVRPAEGSIWKDINTHIRLLIMLKGALSILVGACVAVVFAILGVDCALVVGFFTFVFNFVPNVGAVVAAILPLPLILLNPELSTEAQVMAIGFPFLAHFLIGNFIEPKVLGDKFELHPIIVLLALIFWAVLWGIAGMVLAVPIMVVIRMALLEVHHPKTEAIVNLLEGKMFHVQKHPASPRSPKYPQGNFDTRVAPEETPL